MRDAIVGVLDLAHVQIIESSSPEYRARTMFNASRSDLTVAFAVNHSTPGERLTQKAAGPNRYLAIPLSMDPQGAAQVVFDRMRQSSLSAPVLNVAGNSVGTLLIGGWTQETIDSYIYQVLAAVHGQREIGMVRCGGQTGVRTSNL